MGAVQVDPAALAAIFQHAERLAPRECCGVLLGDDSPLPTIVEAVPIRNAGRAPDEFELDGLELAAAESIARRRGRRIAGFYHSHVDGVEVPSTRDRAGVVWPGVGPRYHLILGLRTRVAAVYRIDSDGEWRRVWESGIPRSAPGME